MNGPGLGMQTFTADDGTVQTGTVYDSDGDGRADEVDLDGDGISDGEDIDGDGQITIWGNLVSSDDTTTAEDRKKEFSSTPTAVANKFAATAPLPGETASGPMVGAAGGVNLVGGMVPTGKPVPGVLTARSQHLLGSCGAFAASGALALTRYNKERTANPSVDVNTLWPAPLYVYQYNATFDGKECSGTNIQANLDRFMLFGAPSESELPYPERSKAVDPNPMYCSTPAVDAAATSAHREANRVGGHVAIRGSGAAWRLEVKRQLDMGRPIVFGVTLPMGFKEFTASRSDAAGKPLDVTQSFKGSGKCTGAHCDGHAMVLTGYDDARSAYRVLNSWGTDWGDNGYIWWDYAALEALQPYGSALIPLPASAAPFGPPNAAAVTVSMVAMTSPAYAKLPPDPAGTSEWAVIARVHWSEPVRVTQVSSNINGSNYAFAASQGMLDGDLQGRVIGSDEAGFNPQSVVGQMAILTVTAITRDGVTITRTLPSFSVPAPTI